MTQTLILAQGCTLTFVLAAPLFAQSSLAGNPFSGTPKYC